MELTKNDGIGIGVTIAIHTLLLLILIWFKLILPDPMPSGGGMEIDFGVSSEGSGNNLEGVPTSNNAIVNPVVADNAVAPQSSKSNNDVLTANNNDPGLNPKKNDSKAITPPDNKKDNKTPVNPDNTNKEIKKAEPQVNNSALYPGKDKTGGQGKDNKAGNVGDPNGKLNGGKGGDGTDPNNTGVGPGVGPGKGPGNNSSKRPGVSFDLGGRGSKILPSPSYDSQEEGMVRVKITVDRNGNVVNATTDGVRGSTTTDKSLHKRAIDAAKISKFAVKSDAPPEQIGYITYNFILN